MLIKLALWYLRKQKYWSRVNTIRDIPVRPMNEHNQLLFVECERVVHKLLHRLSVGEDVTL